MKKSYIKPELVLVSFELSEAIASCGTLLYENHTETDCQMNEFFRNLGVNLTDEQACVVPLDGYCYFTSSDSGQLLMNS